MHVDVSHVLVQGAVNGFASRQPVVGVLVAVLPGARLTHWARPRAGRSRARRSRAGRSRAGRSRAAIIRRGLPTRCPMMVPAFIWWGPKGQRVPWRGRNWKPVALYRGQQAAQERWGPAAGAVRPRLPVRGQATLCLLSIARNNLCRLLGQQGGKT